MCLNIVPKSDIDPEYQCEMAVLFKKKFFFYIYVCVLYKKKRGFPKSERYIEFCNMTVVMQRRRQGCRVVIKEHHTL